ncbi:MULTISPECIES: acetyl/propionyl/methylcrotonyl-CoA carboxylase subunit alpha [Paenarthrobacter]|uniref:acetyl/propionyl/methylcrotonyl-CoA carboxylase subunit alpha n=1 Tax=Paenarthrobacter TaxID=1742992 RepID=UPI00074D371F|nr:acetyl-CoA carboxylase biotin carboxylase subunit [Paenarthrobacter ureafaciens]AMB39052.1 carbamoyl phosphate synthase [Arthrobacter sp. ATCC 21022]KUR64042.1 carbamoyl phosphate synthase [Arthrobacter sp. ATCC 21022]MBN9130214.1 acetyl-CoA carboxylase biotin carboxylase subunit [Paenarthrobacter ureafaciens]RWW95264.1 acetyl-CoA carboxylase biotin carboxylase subunit [Paenarthrobacter ureafaciens]UOD81625.1 acetyl-CoA carboxylase biotin carboxylase subunit [Paenarthrobacter ureafaciens]
MFSKILIANRGEIAVRVIRSCRSLGIKSVAVHSEADSASMHVREADEAVNLGAGAASENYLNIERIIGAALETGAEAIHPGYGFLSENAAFAKAVVDAGLAFIGPSPEAISTMGEKVAARAVAVAAEVPLAPGSRDAISGAADVIAFGAQHGYPILVKASAGGGGRGMRLVESEEQAEEAVAAAVREATAAFGNGEVYLERYLTSARHVEVQVFADKLGNTVYVGDRDCSVQRRHQKLVEESPAPGLSAELRAAMGAAAVRLAEQVGYTGAGTVEFLVEGENFYFLEMNTRIQVEHPVTEMVHGVDLIAEQIKVAAGEELSIRDSLVPQGAAIEARINAEDVAGGRFLPAPGLIEELKAPEGEGLRFDAGYQSGDEVLPYYDSLIGKLIAYGPDRETALARLEQGLQELLVRGVPTTVPASLAVIRHEDFKSAQFTTRWLEEKVDFSEEPEEEEPLARNEVEVGGRFYIIPQFSDRPGAFAGATAAYPAAPAEEASAGQRTRSTRARGKGKASDGSVKAPMQGTIIKVNVEEGQMVAPGDVLFVLEAMKMENPIQAPAAGIVGPIHAVVGDSMAAGTLLTQLVLEGAA